jgi:hypothetical protein
MRTKTRRRPRRIRWIPRNEAESLYAVANLLDVDIHLGAVVHLLKLVRLLCPRQNNEHILISKTACLVVARISSVMTL